MGGRHNGRMADALKPETVVEKTGKRPDEWHRLLDEFGGKEKGHKAMAKWLEEEHGVSAWWAQSLTVDYERARGMREVGQRTGGYGVSASKTLAAPVERVWASFAEEAKVREWFHPEFRHEFVEGGRYEAGSARGEYRRIVPEKRIRMTAEDDGSFIEIRFEAKSPEKTAVNVSQEKIAAKEDVERLRESWKSALEGVKAQVEG
jgi:uncharacterized protein YndB with AHSA1/START domain